MEYDSFCDVNKIKWCKKCHKIGTFDFTSLIIEITVSEASFFFKNPKHLAAFFAPLARSNLEHLFQHTNRGNEDTSTNILYGKK